MRKAAIFVCAAALLVALTLLLLSRLQFSYDLAVFLPPPQSSAEQVLSESLGRGPGSRYLIVALHDAGSDQLELARQALQASAVFSSVRSAASLADQTDIPPLIRRYRYLLSDTDWSEAALQQALTTRAGEMALFGGEEFIDLLRSDPLHKILDVVDGIVAERNIDNDWITPDGARLLLAESKTRAFDIGAQKQAVQVIRDTLQQQPELAKFGKSQIARARQRACLFKPCGSGNTARKF
jgi:predicted exporter